MEDSARSQAPFDERAALAELERMREQIQRYRSQRKDVQAEFSRFVRSFRLQPDPGSAPADTVVTEDEALGAFVHESPDLRPAAPKPRPAEPEFPSSEPVAARLPSAVPTLPLDTQRESPSVTSTQAGEDGRPGERLATPSGPASSVSWARLLVGGALILAAAGALTMWSLRYAGELPAAGSSVPVAASAPPATEPPAPIPAAAAAAPSSRGSEIATTRRVWMRVLVDGERVLEREVPAGTRIPLSAQKTVVIRTGDAGAVRLSLNGEDQGVLGREGEVVTRTFAVPAARPR